MAVRCFSPHLSAQLVGKVGDVQTSASSGPLARVSALHIGTRVGVEARNSRKLERVGTGVSTRRQRRPSSSSSSSFSSSRAAANINLSAVDNKNEAAGERFSSSADMGYEEVYGLLRDLLPLQHYLRRCNGGSSGVNEALVAAFMIVQRMNEEIVSRESSGVSVGAIASDCGLEATQTTRTDRFVAENVELGFAALRGEGGPACDGNGLNAAMARLAAMADHLLGCEGASGPHTAIGRFAFLAILSLGVGVSCLTNVGDAEAATRPHLNSLNNGGLDVDMRALAFGPEGPLLEEFWDNMRRYGLYFLTVVTGGVYQLVKPAVDALRNPLTAVLVIIIVTGSIYLVGLTVSAMLGINEFQYDYAV